MQNVDGYLVVPYIARRTVDLAPALVLAAQLMFGALFGILGLLLADPILATDQGHAGGAQPVSTQPRIEAESAEPQSPG